jgi:hypothetical protein
MEPLGVMPQVSVLIHCAQAVLQIQDRWFDLQDQLPRLLHFPNLHQEHLANGLRICVDPHGWHYAPKQVNLHKLKPTSSTILTLSLILGLTHPAFAFALDAGDKYADPK